MIADSGTGSWQILQPSSSLARRGRLAIAGVISVQVALSVHFALTAMVTHDEYWHLPVGALNCRTLRFDWEPLNPPLVRAWAGLPVAFADETPIPEQPIPPGEYGDRFVRKHGRDFERLYFLGRLMMIALSAVTTLTLAAWAWSLFGPAAGLVTAVVWGLSPTTIANGSLVTTDLGAALAFAAVLWALSRFAEHPTWRRALIWGAALGAAQAVKYTCVLLVPLSFVAWWIAKRPRASRPTAGQIAIRTLGALVLSGVVLNAAYLFEGSFRPFSGFGFRSQAMKTMQNVLGALGNFPRRCRRLPQGA